MRERERESVCVCVCAADVALFDSQLSSELRTHALVVVTLMDVMLLSPQLCLGHALSTSLRLKP